MGELVLGSVGLLALVAKFTDFCRLLANYATQRSAIVTQALAWLAGIVGVILFAHSDFAAGVAVGTLSLDKINFAGLIILGLMISSGASLAIDAKQALDAGDSATKPPLLKSAQTK